MDSNVFHPYVVTGYLTAITTLIIGLFVYLKNKKSSVHQAFLIFSASIAQWSFFSALHAMTLNPDWVLFWFKICHIGGMFIPVFFYYFTLIITGSKKNRSLTTGYIIATLLTIINFATDFFISGVRSDVGTPYYGKAGPFYSLMFTFFSFYILLSHTHLWNAMQKAEGARKKHLKYFFYSSAIGFGIGIVNFAPVYGLTFFPYPYSAACGAIYSCVIAYAILKHRLFDIELIIKKGLIFAALFGMVYISVSGFIFLTGYFLAKQFIPFLSGFLIALAMLVYEPLKAVLTRLTNRFLFQKKMAYTQLVQTLTEKLSQIKDSGSLAGEMTDFLTREMGLEWAGLRDLAELSDENPIVELMRDRTKPFILSPFDTESELSLELKEMLRREKIEALVPIYVERNLYGILLLGKKKSDDAFTGEDEALLKTLMDEVGMFFLSAKLLKESTRSGLELGQRMKMASVKKLARGVHHEVRNPLHAMDLTAETVLENLRKNRYREMSTGGFALEIKTRTKEMLRDIDRIKNSLGRFAQFARPEEDFELKALSLKEELEKFLTLMREGQKLDKIKVHNLVNGEASVLASEGVFQEILFNLFNNAFEAMHGMGELFISTESNGEFIELKFKDTGPGIPKEALPNIFEPYFTTKQDSEAVGIGLSIVKHHMERLGGTIEVSSFSSRAGLNLPYTKGKEMESGAEFRLKFRLAKKHGEVRPDESAAPFGGKAT